MNRLLPVAVTLAALVLAGCAGKDGAADAGPTLPPGFEVPMGVVLTEPGSTLQVGQPATVVLDLDEGTASAVAVTVTKIRKGSIKDFRFFSLDETARTSTPYYVEVRVTNQGPAGLGGVSPPILAHTDTNTVYPANELVGDFKPCPRSTLPSTFLKGAAASLCLVYMLPRGETLKSIDLQPGDPAEAVRWAPAAS